MYTFPSFSCFQNIFAIGELIQFLSKLAVTNQKNFHVGDKGESSKLIMPEERRIGSVSRRLYLKYLYITHLFTCLWLWRRRSLSASYSSSYSFVIIPVVRRQILFFCPLLRCTLSQHNRGEDTLITVICVVFKLISFVRVLHIGCTFNCSSLHCFRIHSLFVTQLLHLSRAAIL